MYSKMVPYDATLESGGEAVKKDPLQYPCKGCNNIGEQGGPLNPNGWLNEGGRISRVLNRIPGINAVAGMHDVFQVNIDKYMGSFARSSLNYPGMLPAAALSYSALMTDYGASVTYQTVARGER